MKIVRYQDSQNRIHYGVQHANSTTRVEGDIFGDHRDTGEAADVQKLLAPIAPVDILCIGLNYRRHAEESNQAAPEYPVLFMKTSSAAQNPGDPIVLPTRLKSDAVDYECELAVVIGKPCLNATRENALDYVLGYTCANDVSERVIQKAEMDQGALLVSKGYDTFCPVGPVIVTDLDPASIAIGTRVNGVGKQASNTSDLLFSVADLVTYLSTAITLVPGDLIITGTPSGVGPLVPGDEVEIFAEGIGVLRNPVVAE
ncbi:MAG: fumarylacetoacetate hydrolase family protein [Planctomycetales bacterium]|nr:fumarylacetoacetate hydrolase family protein [Planctomycetales bacterium]